jgi:hypothetical protein
MSQAGFVGQVVNQVVNLRRIANPPAAPGGQGCQHGLARCASRRRINNPPQINNLPHNLTEPHKI